MFEKIIDEMLYTREKFSLEEKLFESYMSMRKIINELENYKYKSDDKYENSEAFKQGFLAGVKIMSSILLDI